ncbi:hypothetical protein ACHAPK_007585, partial [Fusarium culmorum]
MAPSSSHARKSSGTTESVGRGAGGRVSKRSDNAFILDLQQRAASNQPNGAPAEYVTPGSLDTNINVGGLSDQ